jgi:hypothetical protein
VIRPTSVDPENGKAPEIGAPPRDGLEALGLLCRVCGLDEVPWPRTAYCSERCRHRAAYLARKRRRATAGQLVEGRLSRGMKP